MKKMKPSFNAWESITTERAKDYLCSIADLCSRMPALERLDMTFEHQLLYPKAVFSPYITVLNNTLHSTPSIQLISSNKTTHEDKVLETFLFSFMKEHISSSMNDVSSTSSTCVGLLSGALRKDPGIAQLHLRRSKSFHDLTLPHSLPLQYAHSCPDLSGIHHMHPKLHWRFMTSTTYTDYPDNMPFFSSLWLCKQFILCYWAETSERTFFSNTDLFNHDHY